MRIWDRRLNVGRPKPKLHICICERRQFFLRINSEPLFEPNHLLRKSPNNGLTHDSYVELQQIVRHDSDDISDAEPVGRLSLSEATALVDAAQKAETLSPEHKRIISECLLDT